MAEAYPKEKFDQYIARFNAEDHTAFEDFLHPQMHMMNGTLEYTGIEGMIHHYKVNIWPDFKEVLYVPRFVSDDKHIAIHMNTHFEARHDKEDSLFGPVKKGETFDFNGLIMYDLEDGLFKDIQVAYNSFVFTDVDGNKKDLGLPH